MHPPARDKGASMTEPRSYLPLSGMDLPRFAGIPTFMRLPHVPVDEAA